ncbi:hypothetical protein [Gandjariella thermophila]|uniref:hypothetical protein n=1 Tax=Gandjariella thermophila TaxID=1931992 RepID=UPI0010F92C9A|nr:hypothetical protein [Gandjariella thermophila]
MPAFSFIIQNPYGLCTVARVAVVARNRTEAGRMIKARGLKVNTRRDVDPYFDDDDRFFVEHRADAIWINDMKDLEGGWMALDEFPFGRTSDS